MAMTSELEQNNNETVSLGFQETLFECENDGEKSAINEHSNYGNDNEMKEKEKADDSDGGPDANIIQVKKIEGDEEENENDKETPLNEKEILVTNEPYHGKGENCDKHGLVKELKSEEYWAENKIGISSKSDAYIASPKCSSVHSNGEVSKLLEGNSSNAVDGVHFTKESNVFLGQNYEPQSQDATVDNFEIDQSQVEGDNRDLMDIPPDTFSMLFVASSRSQHVLPTCIYLLQLTILGLIFRSLQLKKDSQVYTPLNIPVAVPPIVTMAQYFACLISVYTADDFVTGILLIRANLVLDYDRLSSISLPRGVLSSFLCCHGRSGDLNISKKWEFSNVMRMTVGIFVIFVSFFFIVQSENVIDLFLNFAAVAFVSELDDASFLLSEKGFFGLVNKRLAEQVNGVKVGNTTFLPSTTEIEGESRNRNGWCGATSSIKRRFRSARIGIFAAVTISMWIGLTTLVVQQTTQSLMCQSITITFDDSDQSRVRYIGGIYDIHEFTRLYGYPVYFQRQGEGKEPRYYIAYCGEGANRWVIGDWEQWVELSENNFCGAIAFSARTQTYDITQVDGIRYYLDSSVQGDVQCNDCKEGLDQLTPCSGRGKCRNRKCECYDNLFGPSCQFGPCSEVEMKDDEFYSFDKTFHQMYDPGEEGRILLVHGRPVYYQKFDSTREPGYGLIFYDGGRWNVLKSHNLFDLHPYTNDTNGEQVIREEDLAVYLRYAFHAEFSSYSTWFLSESTHKGSPSDIPFRAWLSEAGDASSSGTLGDEEFILFCADCTVGAFRDAENGLKTDLASNCVNSFGAADTDVCTIRPTEEHGNVTRCQCDPGFEGVLCQSRPTEGTIALYMLHDGICSICGRDDTYALWILDGNFQTCLSFPAEPLIFNLNGTLVYRQLFLNLNQTHFSLFLSDSNGAPISCDHNMGFKELDSFPRNISDDPIRLNFVVHLEPANNFTGSIVDEPDIDCPKETRIHSRTCSYDLSKVFLTSPSNNEISGNVTSSLSSAWFHLDIQITPMK